MPAETLSSTPPVTNGRSKHSLGLWHDQQAPLPPSRLGSRDCFGKNSQSCVSGARSSGAAVPPGQVQWRQQGTASGRGKSWDLGGRQMWVPCDLGKKTPLWASLSPSVVRRSQVLHRRRNRVMRPAGTKGAGTRSHR